MIFEPSDTVLVDIGTHRFIRKKIVDMRSRKKSSLCCIRGLKRDSFLK